MHQRAVHVVTLGMDEPVAARDRYEQQLRKQLTNLGYPYARVVEADEIPAPSPGRRDIVAVVVGDPTGIEATLAACAQRAPDARFLGLMTRDVDWQPTLVGAFDQIAGFPCQTGELGYRLQQLARDAETRQPVGAELFLHQTLLGHSPVFLNVLDLIRRYAGVDAPVLIEGETGTGKELTARALHRLGERADGPWVPVNCGAIPDTLFESEMFGHQKGAFTDARSARTGLVELANGGTLFLDEVESLSEHGQVSLLRFLQSFEYRPVGATAVRQADVRLVAATNQPLETLVLNQRFREDLYYRLDILHIDLPPLRLRADDVGLLAEHFLRRYAARYNRAANAFSPATLAWLRHQPWPGNTRELENFVHRAVLSTEAALVHHVPDEAEPAPPVAGGEHRYDDLFALPFSEAKGSVVEDFERQYVTACLAQAGGNVSAAAQRAGKHRRAFDRLLQKHQIDKSTYR